MKRLLTLTLACVALALPATAMASCIVYTHLGSQVSSRAATGSCVTKKLLLTSSLLMRCDGSTGHAIARYDFTMPNGWQGTASPTIDASGGTLPKPSLVKLDATHVRVIIRISGPSKVVVSMVNVGFLS